MDVSGFINASTSPQYKQWEQAHGGTGHVNVNEMDRVIDLIQSQSFQTWLQSNPNGTVDQYLAYCQQIQSYHQSPQYQIQLLSEQIDELQGEVESLTEKSTELNSEISDKNDEISSLKGWLGTLSVASTILIIIIILLGIKLRRK